MSETKIYLNCSAKKHEFKDGGHILKLGLNVEKTIAFLQQHKNEKGYVNLIVAKRREPSQYGDTESVYLDTWKPTPKDAPL